jgi:hypothetical protein
MIQEVIEYINTNLNALGYYKNVYGLCELISRDGITLPAQYCNKEYKNLEIEKPLCYSRINGSVNISYIEEQETQVTQSYTSRVYPIRLVSIVDKNIFGKKQNDAYINEKIQDNLLNLLSQNNNKTLAKSLGIDVVNISTNSSSTLRSEWTNEYNGIKELNHNYTICVVDYEIELQGTIKCFTKYGC